MIKIKFIQSCAGVDVFYQGGKFYDLEDSEAQSAIDAGIAVLASNQPEKKPSKKVPVEVSEPVTEVKE